MVIDADLCCSFKVLKPAPPRQLLDGDDSGEDSDLSDDETSSQLSGGDEFDAGNIHKKILERVDTPAPSSPRTGEDAAAAKAVAERLKKEAAAFASPPGTREAEGDP